MLILVMKRSSLSLLLHLPLCLLSCLFSSFSFPVYLLPTIFLSLSSYPFLFPSLFLFSLVSFPTSSLSSYVLIVFSTSYKYHLSFHVALLKVLSRIGSLMRLYHAPSDGKTQSAVRKSVRFLSDAIEVHQDPTPSEDDFDHTHTPIHSVTDEHVHAVVATVCTICLTTVHQSPSLPHLLLLRSMLQSYASRTFFTTLNQHIQLTDSNLESVLRHACANTEHIDHDEEEESKRCAALIHVLVSLAEPSSMQKEAVQSTDALFDCVLSLLHCEVLGEEAVTVILMKLVQVVNIQCIPL